MAPLWRAVAKDKQRWLVIWMGDQKCIFLSSSVLRKARYAISSGCIAVVSTHQPALDPFSLCVIHKEDLCPSKLMMMMI
jgi:hypothetical protein